MESVEYVCVSTIYIVNQLTHPSLEVLTALQKLQMPQIYAHFVVLRVCSKYVRKRRPDLKSFAKASVTSNASPVIKKLVAVVSQDSTTT